MVANTVAKGSQSVRPLPAKKIPEQIRPSVSVKKSTAPVASAQVYPALQRKVSLVAKLPARVSKVPSYAELCNPRLRARVIPAQQRETSLVSEVPARVSEVPTYANVGKPRLRARVVPAPRHTSALWVERQRGWRTCAPTYDKIRVGRVRARVMPSSSCRRSSSPGRPTISPGQLSIGSIESDASLLEGSWLRILSPSLAAGNGMERDTSSGQLSLGSIESDASLLESSWSVPSSSSSSSRAFLTMFSGCAFSPPRQRRDLPRRRLDRQGRSKMTLHCCKAVTCASSLP